METVTLLRNERRQVVRVEAAKVGRHARRELGRGRVRVRDARRAQFAGRRLHDRRRACDVDGGRPRGCGGGRGRHAKTRRGGAVRERRKHGAAVGRVEHLGHAATRAPAPPLRGRPGLLLVRVLIIVVSAPAVSLGFFGASSLSVAALRSGFFAAVGGAASFLKHGWHTSKLHGAHW